MAGGGGGGGGLKWGLGHLKGSRGGGGRGWPQMGSGAP